MNPVVKALIRSRLHGLASGSLALITVTGRRSGREHTFPVGYRQQIVRAKRSRAGTKSPESPWR